MNVRTIDLGAPATARYQPAGGIDPVLGAAKATHQHLRSALAPVLDGLAARTPAGRRPRLWLETPGAGPAWRIAVGRSVETALAEGSGAAREWADLAVIVDALAPADEAQRHDVVRRAWRAVRPGGELVAIERVVPGPEPSIDGIERLLRLLSLGTATEVALRDVRSLRRPGERRRTTALVHLDRLGNPSTH